MSRVLVSGAEGTSSNLGVRVLGEGITALLRLADPTVEIETQNYGHGSSPINIGVPRSLLREALLDSRGGRRWMKSFDAVIDMRGGDSFTDIYGLARLRRESAFAEFARFCKVPVVIGPQTIGPFGTRQGRMIARRLLAQAELVMARDHLSAAAAAQLGRPVDVVTTDVVFALPVPEPVGSRDVVLNVSGLLWESDSHGSREAYRATIRALIAGLRAANREVSLLPHVLDTDPFDRDGPTTQRLADEFGLEAILPVGLEQVRAMLRGSRLVIGSRMHACLNSLSVGTPAIALAYSRKFAPLLRDVGWDHVVSLAEPNAAKRTLKIVEMDGSLKDAAVNAQARANALLENAVAALRNHL